MRGCYGFLIQALLWGCYGADKVCPIRNHRAEPPAEWQFPVEAEMTTSWTTWKILLQSPQNYCFYILVGSRFYQEFSTCLALGTLFAYRCFLVVMEDYLIELIGVPCKGDSSTPNRRTIGQNGGLRVSEVH